MAVSCQPAEPCTPSKSSVKMTPATTPSSSCSSSPSSCRNLPLGNSPYARAKHAQLVDKDLNRAISLFWAAINSRDRIDSALKDMAVAMKQMNRAEEAIEAIKSFRVLCSPDAQDSIDNVLLDLYKKCGRIDEQVELMTAKLKMLDEELAIGGRSIKLARCQGKLHPVSIKQEKTRLLGNLAWAYMQVERYKEAEPFYWQALNIEPDYNKQCNLAICLIQTGRLSEAKSILRVVPKPSSNAECYFKSFQRAWELVRELEPQSATNKREEETTNLSVDVLSHSPAYYFTPQAYSRAKRWYHREFHPPLSVNHNAKHMRREPWLHSRNCRAKEYPYGTNKTKFETPSFVSRDRTEARNGNCYNIEPTECLVRDNNQSTVFEGWKFGSWSSDNSIASTGSGDGLKEEADPSDSFTDSLKLNEESIVDDRSCKKSWADMVEEEEEEDFVDSSEVLEDENSYFNVFQSNLQDLKSQDFTRKFPERLDLVDLKMFEGVF